MQYVVRNVNYTMNELDHAIKWALDMDRADFNNLKESCGRVAAHRMACERAFVDQLTGPNCGILRQAIKDLSGKGYNPSDGIWVD